MAHAVMRGSPTKAQLYLENIINELVKETGRSEDRHSLNRIVFKCFRDHPDRLCLIDGKTDERVTNGEILRRSVRVARALASRRLAADEVVVTMAQNHIDFTSLYYGALFAGATLFNLEPILTAFEVQHYLKIIKTAIVFVDTDNAELMKEALKELREKPSFVLFSNKAPNGELTFLDFIQNYKDDIEDYWPVPVDQNAAPLLFTTGGSTGLGLPKIVPSTNAGLVAQVPTEWTYANRFPRSEELMLMSYHGQWLIHTKLFVTAVIYGATILVQSQVSTNSNTIDLIRTYKPTWIVKVPPNVNDIITSTEYRHGDFHSIKMFVLVGLTPYRGFLAQLKKELRPDAILCNRFGMTEAHGYVCMGDLTEPPALGPLVNIFDYKLVDKEGKVVCKNDTGELHLKSDYCLAKTYYGDDEAARNMYTSDGWFRTGDLLREDDHGGFHYVDRIKFIIFNIDYQVSPLEVEEVVCSVEGVAAAAVVEVEGAGPAALVVPAPGADPSREAIKEAVKAKLNRYKHLSGVGFISTLPRTAVGKLHRRKCAEIIKEMIANKQCC